MPSSVTRATRLPKRPRVPALGQLPCPQGQSGAVPGAARLGGRRRRGGSGGFGGRPFWATRVAPATPDARSPSVVASAHESVDLPGARVRDRRSWWQYPSAAAAAQHRRRRGRVPLRAGREHRALDRCGAADAAALPGYYGDGRPDVHAAPHPGRDGGPEPLRRTYYADRAPGGGHRPRGQSDHHPVHGGAGGAGAADGQGAFPGPAQARRGQPRQHQADGVDQRQ